MEEKKILQTLEDVFRRVLNNDSLVLSPDLTASDVNEWNSLTHMIIITEVEKVFSVKFKLRDLNKMHNVGDLIELIQSKQ